MTSMREFIETLDFRKDQFIKHDYFKESCQNCKDVYQFYHFCHAIQTTFINFGDHNIATFKGIRLTRRKKEHETVWMFMCTPHCDPLHVNDVYYAGQNHAFVTLDLDCKQTDFDKLAMLELWNEKDIDAANLYCEQKENGKGIKRPCTEEINKVLDAKKLCVTKDVLKCLVNTQ